MSAGTDSGYRRIEAGACTWCGHQPHAGACGNRIRTRAPMPHGPDVNRACPCRKRATS